MATILNGREQTATFSYLEDVHGIELNVFDVPIISGAASVNINIFKITGTIEVISQIAQITEVTALTNMTAVYADVWDGTNAVELTKAAPGATLSGSPVGTIFTKDKVATEP